jgi:hypothetical protein
MSKILFMNIGWMDSYKGLVGDSIIGGGKFIEQWKYGFEIFNFLPWQGNLYGYAETPSIRIERLGARPGAVSVPGVLVVWTARNPRNGGTYIVGWYGNATVHRKSVEPTFAQNRLIGTFVAPGIKAHPGNVGKHADFFASTAEDDCYLIPPDKRTVQVPRGRNGMGKANIWYADQPSMAAFVKDVLQYVRGKTKAVQAVRKYGPGGEGADHKSLKEWCALNPQALGLQGFTQQGVKEYQFISGDLADIVFSGSGGHYAAVEIETTDSLPGAHQALKYKTLLCAEKGLPINSNQVLSVLVAWNIPGDVRDFCEKYSIKWVEKKI